jgi:hypothetical protein
MSSRINTLTLLSVNFCAKRCETWAITQRWSSTEQLFEAKIVSNVLGVSKASRPLCFLSWSINFSDTMVLPRRLPRLTTGANHLGEHRVPCSDDTVLSREQPSQPAWLTIIQKGIVLYGRRGHGPRPFSESWKMPRPSTFYVQNTPICRVSELPYAIPPERNRPDI